jgi:hypothetical protein
MRRPSRRTVLVGLVVVGVLVSGWVLRRVVADGHGGLADRADVTRDASAPRAPAAKPVPPADGHAPRRPEPPSLDDMQTPWAAVDLEALRAELPDNLYWKMASPTKDPAVIQEREAERARWNVEYGKILSNTATPDEIDTYYAHRYRLSSDYVEFATFLLADYGDQLDARDVGLLKIAIELHMARLEEIPRQIAEAHERCAAHEAVRRQWLESQKAFDGEKSD